MFKGNLPFNQAICGCGRPVYEQSNAMLSPALISKREDAGTVFRNRNGTGSRRDLCFIIIINEFKIFTINIDDICIIDIRNQIRSFR